MKVNYDEILVDDEIVEIMIRHLDIDGNGNIEKHEFKSGVEKWLALCNLQKKLHHNNQVRNILINNTLFLFKI